MRGTAWFLCWLGGMLSAVVSLGERSLSAVNPHPTAAECVRSPTDCRPQGNDCCLSELFATTCWATDLLLKVLHIYNILKKIISQNTWLTLEACQCPAAIKINPFGWVLESCLALLIAFFFPLWYFCCHFLYSSIRDDFSVRSLLDVFLPKCHCNIFPGELL